MQTLTVPLTHRCDLFDRLDTIQPERHSSAAPRPMEDFGQGYGFILYRTTLHGPRIGPEPIELRGLADRAVLYLNGRYIGRYMRDRVSEPIRVAVGEGDRLDILVENCGRVCFGDIIDRKGILEAVTISRRRVFNWEIRCLPMDSDVPYDAYTGVSLPERPAFYRGVFDAIAGVDTYFDASGWEKGFVRVNGFNIGRYWSAGPQTSLYVPGDLLRSSGNVVEVFELHTPSPTVVFTDSLRLTSPVSAAHTV